MRMLAIFGACVVVVVGVQFSDAQKTYCEEHLGEATAKQEGNHCFFKAAGSENALDFDGEVYIYNMAKVKDLCEKTHESHLPRLSQKKMTTAERKAFYDLAAAIEKKAYYTTNCTVKAVDNTANKITVECGFGEEESDTSNAFGDGVSWTKPSAEDGFFVFYHASDVVFVNANNSEIRRKDKDKMPVMCHQIKTPSHPITTPDNKASINGVGTMATALIVIMKAIAAFVM